ncbi:uncharacterized protein BT62DRAFT_789704 [Guyanagaster necrorhizus]|uniref:Uncharacterized protein n=1 Tax=Guyanagaster necrorhizus TaxID=856835 RepID=A0A9P8AVA3_9AGAR|nr:uncharacterized protein BT62DRAFT_789704 [Guyanagaster necrorhizus MCA 3950]KAG7447712.1 hypothetical protein BT62DRAFT_789704 [Guyanagaster necrorhizus MCA 3950]
MENGMMCRRRSRMHIHSLRAKNLPLDLSFKSLFSGHTLRPRMRRDPVQSMPGNPQKRHDLSVQTHRAPSPSFGTRATTSCYASTLTPTIIDRRALTHIANIFRINPSYRQDPDKLVHILQTRSLFVQYCRKIISILQLIIW